MGQKSTPENQETVDSDGSGVDIAKAFVKPTTLYTFDTMSISYVALLRKFRNYLPFQLPYIVQIGFILFSTLIPMI